jgi:hypothetical protein
MASFAIRTTSKKPDLLIHEEGAIVLFTPMTAAAKLWINGHVAGDPEWFGPSLVVGHKYANDLLDGISEAGLSFSNSPSERGH